MLEAVLGDVVARAQHEGGVDLGVLVEGRGDRAAHRALAVRAARGGERAQGRDLGLCEPRGHALARVAQARGPGRLDVDVGDEQLLGELRRSRGDAALVVGDERVAVEDELVLAADERAERHRGEVVAGALGDHLLALVALARLVGGGRDVDDQPGAGQRLVGDGGPGLPDVLADRHADRDAVDLDDRPAGAALEVAHLVEDAVVGEVDLAVDRLHAAVGADRGGVVGVLGTLGEPDDRDDVHRLGGDPLQRLAGIGEEVLLEQEVLRRVAGDRELGEEDDLGTRLPRLAQAREDLLGVAGDVADGGVELGQSDPHQQSSMRVGRGCLRIRRLKTWRARGRVARPGASAGSPPGGAGRRSRGRGRRSPPAGHRPARRGRPARRSRRAARSRGARRSS